MLITFSGLDGAGKTTLIQGLRAAIEKQNRTVTVLTMYDHVTFYALVRFWRDRLAGLGRGRPGPSIGARDPATSTGEDRASAGVRRVVYGIARSSAMRRAVYFVDLLRFLLIRLREEKIRKRVLILDRYFYDALADVAGAGWLGWAYIRGFLRLVPTPEAPIFVDVSGEQAFARKAEYSLEYLRERRATYQRIFRLVHRPIVIANDNLDAAARALWAAVGSRMAGS